MLLVFTGVPFDSLSRMQAKGTKKVQCGKTQGVCLALPPTDKLTDSLPTGAGGGDVNRVPVAVICRLGIPSLPPVRPPIVRNTRNTCAGGLTRYGCTGWRPVLPDHGKASRSLADAGGGRALSAGSRKNALEKDYRRARAVVQALRAGCREINAQMAQPR